MEKMPFRFLLAFAAPAALAALLAPAEPARAISCDDSEWVLLELEERRLDGVVDPEWVGTRTHLSGTDFAFSFAAVLGGYERNEPPFRCETIRLENTERP